MDAKAQDIHEFDQIPQVRMKAKEIVKEVCISALTHMLREAELGNNTHSIMHTLKSLENIDTGVIAENSYDDITLWSSPVLATFTSCECDSAADEGKLQNKSFFAQTRTATHANYIPRSSRNSDLRKNYNHQDTLPANATIECKDRYITRL